VSDCVCESGHSLTLGESTSPKHNMATMLKSDVVKIFMYHIRPHYSKFKGYKYEQKNDVNVCDHNNRNSH
jgi:hypothetical protein